MRRTQSGDLGQRRQFAGAFVRQAVTVGKQRIVDAIADVERGLVGPRGHE